MNVSVRLATPDDIETLLSLMDSFYAESGFALDGAMAASAFRSLMSRPSLGCVFVAYADGVPAGHTVLTTRFTMEHSGLSGYVDDLYVRPERRRLRIGHRLMTALVAECRVRECRSLQVEVGRENIPAVKLYAAFGLHEAQDGRMLASGPLGPEEVQAD